MILAIWNSKDFLKVLEVMIELEKGNVESVELRIWNMLRESAMSVYGVHSTKYQNLNNEQRYSMFRESIYGRLGKSEKLDSLQETVNRDALEKGEIGAPEVRFANLSANEIGNTANGAQSFEYNGQTIQHPANAYNIESLNIVLHENNHCFQNQVIDEMINIKDDQNSAEYQSNSFTSKCSTSEWEISAWKLISDR